MFLRLLACSCNVKGLFVRAPACHRGDDVDGIVSACKAAIAMLVYQAVYRICLLV